jgi:ribosome biogenesis GTPase A
MKKGFWTVTTEVIKKADIILEVLDARMPELTRIEKFESKAKHFGKKVILVINKADIVSRKTIASISRYYSDLDYVVVSCKKDKGISDLIKMIKDKIKHEKIKVAVIGYPNTGKSSLINRLSKSGKARTSSESGFTKGMQLINGKQGLMLVDTPGIVPFADRDEVRLGLVSGISPEKLKDPENVAYELIKIFKRNNPAAFEKTYSISCALEPYEILEKIAKNSNMLRKGGMVDEKRAAIRLLFDWHRGKIRI